MTQLAPSRSFALPENRPTAGAVDFAVLGRSLMLAKGSIPLALAEAEATPGAGSRPAAILRAAGAAGTTADADWARPLVDFSIVSAAFVESLAAAGLFDRLLVGGAQRVPLKGARIIINTVSLTGSEVGETVAKPISALSLTGNDLVPIKVAAIVVLSEDLLRVSVSGATAFISSELRKGVISATDTAFIPALVSGLTAIPGSADPVADILAAVTSLGASASSKFYLAVSPTTFLTLGLMTGTDGALLFDLASGIGGIVPVASDAVDDDQAVLIDASRLVAADDGVVLDGSQQASLYMDSAPPGTAPLTNLWADNLRALRAERFFSFRAGGGVALIEPITWGS